MLLNSSQKLDSKTIKNLQSQLKINENYRIWLDINHLIHIFNNGLFSEVIH